MSDAPADPSAPSTPPAAPAPEPVPAVPASAVPADTGTTPMAAQQPEGPSRAEQSARTKLKVAGLIMLIFGAYVLLNTAPSAFALSQPGALDTMAGGPLKVTAPGHPNATVLYTYKDGTTSTARTDAAGNATLNATYAAFTLRVSDGSGQVERRAVVPDNPLVLTVAFADADFKAGTSGTEAPPRIGLDPGALYLFWVAPAIALATLVGGVAAFRRKGHNVAMLGAILYFAGCALLVYLSAFALASLIFAGTAALCLWFIHKGRGLATPGWAFWARA